MSLHLHRPLLELPTHDHTVASGTDSATATHVGPAARLATMGLTGVAVAAVAAAALGAGGLALTTIVAIDSPTEFRMPACTTSGPEVLAQVHLEPDERPPPQ